MKIILLIFSTLLSYYTFANEIEVINLYESKSLDQMVLENLNDKKEIEEKEDGLNEADEKDTNIDEIEENVNTEIEVNQIETSKDNFIFKNNITNLKDYFDNLQKTNSKTLQKEIVQFLENLQLNIEIDQDNEIFFLIINYLTSIGQINKSYELVVTNRL